MVVGAAHTTVNGNSGQGAAYVFTESGSAWTQTAELTASDGAAGNYFGYSVAISGNTVVVGAYNTTVGGIKQGAAYVFTESGSAWTQTAELTASDGAAGNDFGDSVAISGNTVVVGAYHAKVGGTSSRVRPTCSRSQSGWADLDPDRQAHRLRWRGGRLLRRLGRDQRQTDTVVAGRDAANGSRGTSGGCGEVFTSPAPLEHNPDRRAHHVRWLR